MEYTKNTNGLQTSTIANTKHIKTRNTPPHQKLNRLLRLKQIIGPNGILPFSRSTFYNRINAGEIDPPIKLGDRVSAWPESCILDYIQRMEGQTHA